MELNLLYLDLLKKTLSYMLWPEPPTPIANIRKKVFLQKFWNNMLSKAFAMSNRQIAKFNNFSEQDRIEGKIWPAYADTMIGLKRLDNIQFCIEQVLKDGIEGDLIETGVWRGGGCIFMRGILAAHSIKNRKVFVADSFEGLPEPDKAKYPKDIGDEHYKEKALAISLESVKDNFKKYNLLDDQVVFLKGWFEDTLPNAPIKKLSILRLDGDMYGSTMDALNSLYPKLSKGGYCIIDDYALHGCKAAIDDYRAKNVITDEIIEIDWSGRYWRKTE